nr:tetratricopeptide repeat protein [Ktedonobacteraceae bacterium]
MGRRLALIVGVNSYQDASFRPLHYAENDALAIAQWLVNIKGGNWSPPDVQHVQGAYATHELIESLITRVCTQTAGPGDLVLIYFAGHAFVDETSGDGYLALANTNAQQPGTAIHLPTLAQQAMGRSRAAHVVFLLDCFQNGRAWDMRRTTPFDSRPLLGPTLLNALQHTGDRLILSSCRGNEGISEAGEKSLGRFTYHMILGLCGPASDPTTKQVTLQRLYAFLSQTVGEQQRPQLFGQESTPLVLVGDMPTSAASKLPNIANTPLPPTQAGQSSPLQSASFTPPQTGGLSFQQGASYAPTAQPFAATSMQTQASTQPTTTGQLSPTTSGQLSISEAEQQSTMLLRQARHLVQMHNPGEAFTALEQALQIMPNNVPALILQGQLLGSVGHAEEALHRVEKALQIEANNALGWSLQAALLTNTGQYQTALQAIERSLELDPNNPESYSIKTSIMGHLAAAQSRSQGQSRRFTRAAKQNSGPTSFFRSAGIHLLGLIVGIIGAVLPVLQPHVPITVAFLLQSLGLAILCVNAAYGSYVHGFFRFAFTLLIGILTAAILGGVAFVGGLNKIGQGRIYVMLQNNPALLVPLLIFGIWLAAAAALPPIGALFAFIGGLITGVRRKQRK